MKSKKIIYLHSLVLFFACLLFLGGMHEASAAVTQALTPRTTVSAGKIVKNRDANVSVVLLGLRGNAADNEIERLRVRVNEINPTVDDDCFVVAKLWVSNDATFSIATDSVIDTENVSVGGDTEFDPDYIIGTATRYFFVSLDISDDVYDGASFDVTMEADAVDSGGAGGGNGVPVLNPLTAAEARDLTVDLEVYQLVQPQTMVMAAQSIEPSSFDTPVIRFMIAADHPSATLNAVRVQINQRGGTITASDFANLKIWSSSNSTFEQGVDNELPLSGLSINVGSETTLDISPNYSGGNNWFIVTVATSATLAIGDQFDITMDATSVDTGGRGGGANYPVMTALAAAAARDLTCTAAAAAWTNCGPYAAWGNRNCGAGAYTVFSNATAQWPNRAVTLADGPNYSYVGPNFIAGRCGQGVNVAANFAAIPITGDVTAFNKITGWNCVDTDCVCVGSLAEACWCADYDPVTNNLSCNPDASASIPATSDNALTNIENLPPNILTAGNWMHCDASDPVAVYDPRDHAAQDNRTIGAGLCAWTARDMAHCPNQGTANYAVGQEYIYNCSAADHDAPYDTIQYAFQVRKQGGAGAFVNCTTAGVWSGDFWCQQEAGNPNRLHFRSTDPAGKYEAKCIARDLVAATGVAVGAEDFALTIIQSQGDPVGCDLDDTGDSSYCPGESTTINANIHPGWADVDGQWNFAGGPFNAWGNYPSFNFTFNESHIGSNNFEMNVRLTADPTKTGTCSVPINVLNPSCSCRIMSVTDDGGNAVNASQIKTGDNVVLGITNPCINLAAANPFMFEVHRDGSCATTGYTVNPLGATGCPSPFQASNSITLDNMAPGAYEIPTAVTQSDGSTKNCAPCNFLVNTAASNWWERRPQ